MKAKINGNLLEISSTSKEEKQEIHELFRKILNGGTIKIRDFYEPDSYKIITKKTVLKLEIEKKDK